MVGLLFMDGTGQKFGKAVVFVDHQESASEIAGLLESQGVVVEQARLPVGDFLVSEQVAVERKTGQDFVSSMLDGRLFDQAKRLSESFPKPVLIIEGDWHGWRQVSEKAVLGALAALALDFGICVLPSNSTEETAALVALMANREQLGQKHSVRLHGQKKAMSEDARQQFIVESLPSVGPELARRLLKKFGTVERVFCAKTKRLVQVDGIGEKKAGTIRKILSKTYEPDGQKDKHAEQAL